MSKLKIYPIQVKVRGVGKRLKYIKDVSTKAAENRALLDYNTYEARCIGEGMPL